MKKIVMIMIMLFSTQVFSAVEMTRSSVQGYESVPPRNKTDKRIKKMNKKKKKKGDTTCPKIDC